MNSFPWARLVSLARRSFLVLLLATGASIGIAGEAQNADAVKSEPRGMKSKNYGRGEFHSSFMARIKKGPIGIVFYGDSITEGIGKDGKEPMLAKFEPYQPAVFGVSSEETVHLLYRLTTGEADITPNPKVVVLMIGVNDISHGKAKNPADVAKRIKENLDVIRGKLPDSKVMLMSLLPFGKKIDSPVRQKVIAINKIIKEYADGQAIIYVDAYSKFLDQEGTVIDGMMDGASLHPLRKGYQVWCDTLMPVVEPYLK